MYFFCLGGGWCGGGTVPKCGETLKSVENVGFDECIAFFSCDSPVTLLWLSCDSPVTLLWHLGLFTRSEEELWETLKSIENAVFDECIEESRLTFRMTFAWHSHDIRMTSLDIWLSYLNLLFGTFLCLGLWGPEPSIVKYMSYYKSGLFW